MEQLVIRLGNESHEPVHWAVWSVSTQDVIASGELANAGELETLIERTHHRKAVVVVPGASVRLKWVTLPGNANRKLISAIPFMLEDELAEDINDLFFALGPKKGNQQAVAIVAHNKIIQWQEWLFTAGITAQSILPDTLALPAPTEGNWVGMTLGEELIVRQGTWQGSQASREFLTSVLAFETKQQPETVKFTALSEVDLHSVPNLDLHTENAAYPPIGVLAQYAIGTSFNLLQGQYKPKKTHNQAITFWRVPALLLALVVAISVGERALQLQELKQQNTQLAEQISASVKQGFPNLGAYRDVRLKIEQEMERLEQTGDGSSFLVMLAQLNQAFVTSQVTPQTLRFDGIRTEIRMQAQGKDYNALEAFKRSAEAAGFTVEQGAINNRNNTYIGTLAIRGAS